LKNNLESPNSLDSIPSPLNNEYLVSGRSLIGNPIATIFYPNTTSRILNLRPLEQMPSVGRDVSRVPDAPTPQIARFPGSPVPLSQFVNHQIALNALFRSRPLFRFYLRVTAAERKNLIVIVLLAKRKWLGWQRLCLYPFRLCTSDRYKDDICPDKDAIVRAPLLPTYWFVYLWARPLCDSVLWERKLKGGWGTDSSWSYAGVFCNHFSPSKRIVTGKVLPIYYALHAFLRPTQNLYLNFRRSTNDRKPWPMHSAHTR